MDRATRKTRELEIALRPVLRALDDGQKGMASIGELLKDETLRRHFLMESLRRANFRGELENVLHSQGVADVHEKGTASAAVTRAWAGLKAKLGADDEAMIESAEKADEEAKSAYRTALAAELPLPVRQLLVKQQTHILVAQESLRERRDGLKAA